MKVGVNGAILARGTSGSARATQDLLDALHASPGVSVDLRLPKRGRSRSRVLNAVADARWNMWSAARLGPQDLFISPCNVGTAPRRTPHVLVVYDTMIFDHPEYFDRGFVEYTRLLLPVSVRRADLVVTMSERSRRRLEEIVDGKAPVEVLRWRGSGLTREPAFPKRKRVVMLGATEPHKCHVNGVDAVRTLRDQTGEDIHLDVVGPEGRAEAEVRARLRDRDPEQAWTRRLVDVPSSTRDALLDDAWVLLQPSLDEGFGLPLLEATERGIAVVHSGAGAMPEVLPSSSARSRDPQALALRMQALLEENAWSAAVRLAVSETRDLTPHGFNDRVSDLLGRVVAGR